MIGCAGAAVLTVVALGIAIFLTPGPVLRETFLKVFGDTEFAARFDEAVFRSIPLGATREAVIAELGPPFGERDATPVHSIVYADGPVDAFAATGAIHELRAYTRFEFDREGRLDSMRGQLVLERGLTSGKILRDSSGAGKNHLGVTAQQLEQWKAQRATRSDIEARFGPPTAVHRHDAVRWMEYSRSPSSSSYLRRWIGLDGEGRVCFQLAEAHAD